MRHPLIVAALAALAAGPVLADLPTCHLPDAVAATCVHVDRDATAGQWVLWHVATSTPTRGRTYPVADGGPIPGMDPAYRMLLGIRVEPPEIDSRFQAIPAQCPEQVDLAVGTLTTTCTATVRNPADLKGAVDNAAGERIAAAMSILGLRDPADQIRALGLFNAWRHGQTLTADQEAWLTALGNAGVAYVDAVREVQAAIETWIDQHPGQIPDVGPAVWPPLPSAPQ